MNSLTDLAGTDGFTTISRSDELMLATGRKSRMSLNGLCGSSVSLTVCVFDITSSV